jgi:hypothetical protein
VLAIGAGGLEVALAMAGQPFHVKMPKIWGVKLVGTLPDWVSAKDVILEMLRRHFLSRFSRRLRRRLFGGCLLESLLCSHSVFNCTFLRANVSIGSPRTRPASVSAHARLYEQSPYECLTRKPIKQLVAGGRHKRPTFIGVLVGGLFERPTPCAQGIEPLPPCKAGTNFKYNEMARDRLQARNPLVVDSVAGKFLSSQHPATPTLGIFQVRFTMGHAASS